jgi:hypothetical protein
MQKAKHKATITKHLIHKQKTNSQQQQQLLKKTKQRQYKNPTTIKNRLRISLLAKHQQTRNNNWSKKVTISRIQAS